MNFGSQYTLGAPTAYVHGAAVTNIPGSNPVYITPPSSFTQDVSPAVVGGVVSLMLEKNYYLTATQIKNALIASADKVGGYNYVLGISQEMGHGRVSCIQAMGQISPTSLSPSTQVLSFTAYAQDGILHLSLPDALIGKEASLTLTDMMGRVVEQHLFRGAAIVEIPLTAPISTGIYHLNIFQNESCIQPYKLLMYE